MLKCPSLIFKLTGCKCQNIFFSLFIQNNTCEKYWSVFLSWEMYCVNITKFTTAQVKCTAADASCTRSDAITDTIWCTIVFQSASIHCFTLLYLWKIFNSAKVEIEQNWWLSCVTSGALEISCLMSFFFLVTVMLFSISCFNQWTRYVTVLLSSWCSTLIIIVAWILTKWWAHTKLSTEWTHAASFSDIFSSCCLLIWFLMNWCV